MDYFRSGVIDYPGQHGDTLSLLKIQKLAGRVAHTCNPSFFQEAELSESLEPRRWRLQWVKIAPLDSSLGDRAIFSLKEKKD